MARPVALTANVSLSPPNRGMTVVDRHGRVNPDPNFVSLDVLVEVQLDDGTALSPPDPTYGRGGPRWPFLHLRSSTRSGHTASPPRSTSSPPCR